ncbi:hypothetical protein J6590_085794 [Homalodisca vitripennis]|nr:hypothetical protein J6590_085794 [Homalodisca vitripennis]
MDIKNNEEQNETTGCPDIVDGAQNYLAGWVAKKHLKKYPFLGDYTYKSESSPANECSWIRHCQSERQHAPRKRPDASTCPSTILVSVYLRLLERRNARDYSLPNANVYALDSYFSSVLRSGHERAGHYRDQDLLAYDTILVPVHEELVAVGH